MLVSTLDIIVRRWLLERSMPIHYYMEGLYHGATCLKLLTEDTLQIINAANLPIDDTGTAMLPDDFEEDLSVNVTSGQQLAPLPKQDWITPIRLNSSTNGQFIPYSDDSVDTDGQLVFFGFPGNWTYLYNIDDIGESTGRRFGGHGGTSTGYQIFRERRQIQFTENLANSNAVLLYISDGQRADNASRVNSKAIQCIKSFIDWQKSPNATINNSREAATYYNEKRRLKSLLNPLTPVDIKNIRMKAYTAGLKY